MNWFKYAIGLIVCFVLRIIPFRPPNVEPLLAAGMPFAKQYGDAAGFFFGFLSIVIFDVATGTVGTWTAITSLTYGVVCVGAAMFFKRRKATSFNFLVYSVVGTIFYDAITGLSIGPLFFGQSFVEAFVGQIPFTAMHLLGNSVLAVTVSPALYRWVVMNKRLETLFHFQRAA